MAFIGDASNTVDIGYNLIVKVYNEKVKVGQRIGLVLRFREHHIIHTEEEVVEKTHDGSLMLLQNLSPR